MKLVRILLLAIENLYQSQVNAKFKCDTIVLKIPIQFVKNGKSTQLLISLY